MGKAAPVASYAMFPTNTEYGGPFLPTMVWLFRFAGLSGEQRENRPRNFLVRAVAKLAVVPHKRAPQGRREL